MKQVTIYKGVGILTSKGYFYPSVDLETLCYSIEECVDWIEEYYNKWEHKIVDPYIIVQYAIRNTKDLLN